MAEAQTQTRQVRRLAVGEKYLSISVLGQIKLAAFPNPNKGKDSKQPDFVGNGVAVWVNHKRSAEEANVL